MIFYFYLHDYLKGWGKPEDRREIGENGSKKAQRGRWKKEKGDREGEKGGEMEVT